MFIRQVDKIGANQMQVQGGDNAGFTFLLCLVNMDVYAKVQDKLASEWLGSFILYFQWLLISPACYHPHILN